MEQNAPHNALSEENCEKEVAGFAFVDNDSKPSVTTSVNIESVYQMFSHKYRKSLNKLAK